MVARILVNGSLTDITPRSAAILGLIHPLPRWSRMHVDIERALEPIPRAGFLIQVANGWAEVEEHVNWWCP